LYGNMWKFDFTGTSTNNWDVAYKTGSTPVPFFQSCTSSTCNADELQAITVRPSVGRHPDGGVMVYWGTGKYFETGDDIVPDDPQIQTVYGVRDQGVAITNSRASLQEQTIDYQVTGTIDYRVVSTTPTNYASYNGWYLDLVPPSGTAEGERVISTPLLRHDRLIFTSAIPSADACDFGGSGWLMELDAVNGTSLTYAVMDVDGDNTFDFYTLNDGTTVPITGKRLDGLGEPGAIITAGDVEYKYISTSSGAINVTLEQGGGSGFGRQSWRQIR
jgi:type IV pilus assembly protein PilY1